MCKVTTIFAVIQVTITIFPQIVSHGVLFFVALMLGAQFEHGATITLHKQTI